MRANKKLFCIGAILLALFSCGKNKSEDKPPQGKNIHNEDIQGVQHENRDNQFPESRNDNTEGNGLETGAPTDTIDGDGDTKKL
ncbi:hypothetical protein CHU92_08370 [Flavobacterium cyanobacteriorum]|uniref:Lipoprotein n=1 Tax=Flavobacterium cyanobacteriorum TaxID=2022802 RepID=A0A255Z9N5_9FLAO|nr:hypothetical protein [Flavobacterium cyanobacteriorum]OYQ37340.1 hypothetical protein CHU92_08370 [Flavobacterium cyanobacteriorum]